MSEVPDVVMDEAKEDPEGLEEALTRSDTEEEEAEEEEDLADSALTTATEYSVQRLERDLNAVPIYPFIVIGKMTGFGLNIGAGAGLNAAVIFEPDCTRVCGADPTCKDVERPVEKTLFGTKFGLGYQLGINAALAGLPLGISMTVAYSVKFDLADVNSPYAPTGKFVLAFGMGVGVGLCPIKLLTFRAKALYLSLRGGTSGSEVKKFFLGNKKKLCEGEGKGCETKKPRRSFFGMGKGKDRERKQCEKECKVQCKESKDKECMAGCKERCASKPEANQDDEATSSQEKPAQAQVSSRT